MGIAKEITAQDDAAREVIARSRALLARGNLNEASDLLTQALDNAYQPQPALQAQLAVQLACILATRGHLAAAEKRLNSSRDYITDRRSAVNIYCTRAIELACAGGLEQALYRRVMAHASKSSVQLPAR